MGRLDGKVTIVTGAARGIGKAIAAACAREGSGVVLVDVDPGVEQAAAEVGGHALVADVTVKGSEDEAVALAVARYGRVTSLVNNAGRVDEVDILTTSDELWAQTMSLNLEAPFRWCRAAIPAMLDAGGGAIVNVSSIEATHVRPNHFPYVVSKSGLNCLTRGVAVDMGRRGIRCNSISPGSISTEMFENYVRGKPELLQKLVDMNYMGRVGTTEEIGNAAVYLLSDETGFLNGHELIVDGARTVAT
jgi:2-keto-3-deoxy-L-fuconate dehydrogenase